MPAYRSPAEGEIREAVVARIRQNRPDARIIHEINVSSYGPNRIDLVAVDRAEIIAVEIKSAKDKLDRLPAQIEAMKRVAHHVVVALHEKFLVEQQSNPWASHYERDGIHYIRTIPTGLERGRGEFWVFPERRRATKSPIEGGHDSIAVWHFPRAPIETAPPEGALRMLWREELMALCGVLRVPASRRSDMASMTAALRWHCTGKELTRGICAMLRARRCAEADPEIIERIAA